jgi:hypothetical protein
MPCGNGRCVVPLGLSVASIVVCVASLLAASPGHAQAARAAGQAGYAGMAGIVEGGATLIRQTTRYTLAEGVVLADQDIVETAPGGFVQIELPGGVLVGMGASTRVMLRPRVAKGLSASPLYLLQGWLKTSAAGAFRYASPAFELSTQAATTVVHASGMRYEVFLEGGAAKLATRDGAQATLQLGGGDFAQRREGAPPTVGKRPTSEFLAGVPRQFRDRLPPRGERFAGRNIVPKPVGDIAYGDVSAWLRTEPGLRLPLLPLWRARTADLDFRAAAKANLAHHPEWEPHADPEGYARRLAAEAERRRQREEARQAARAAAAAQAAGAVPADGTRRG